MGKYDDIFALADTITPPSQGQPAPISSPIQTQSSTDYSDIFALADEATTDRGPSGYPMMDDALRLGDTPPAPQPIQQPLTPQPIQQPLIGIDRANIVSNKVPIIPEPTEKEISPYTIKPQPAVPSETVVGKQYVTKPQQEARRNILEQKAKIIEDKTVAADPTVKKDIEEYNYDIQDLDNKIKEKLSNQSYASKVSDILGSSIAGMAAGVTRTPLLVGDLLNSTFNTTNRAINKVAGKKIFKEDYKIPDYAYNNPVTTLLNEASKSYSVLDEMYANKDVFDIAKESGTKGVAKYMAEQSLASAPIFLAIGLGQSLGIPVPVTLSAMGAVSAGQKKGQLLEARKGKTVTPLRADNETWNSVTVGAIDGITEAFGSIPIFNRVLKQLAKEGTEIAVEAAKKPIRHILKSIFKGILEESVLEEGSASLAQTVTDAATGVKPINVRDAAADLLTSMGAAAPLGGTVSGFGGAVETLRAKQFPQQPVTPQQPVAPSLPDLAPPEAPAQALPEAAQLTPPIKPQPEATQLPTTEIIPEKKAVTQPILPLTPDEAKAPADFAITKAESEALDKATMLAAQNRIKESDALYQQIKDSIEQRKTGQIALVEPALEPGAQPQPQQRIESKRKIYDQFYKEYIDTGLTPEQSDINVKELLNTISNEQADKLSKAFSVKDERTYTDVTTGLKTVKWGLDNGFFKMEGKKATINPEKKVIMVDIDHFKTVNDKYGHDVGNEVLGELGSILKNRIGTIGNVVRYGGEEIAVFPKENLTTEEEKYILDSVEDARSDIKAKSFADNKLKGVTFSAGFGEDAISSDKDLYKAKQTGRDQTIVRGVKHVKRTIGTGTPDTGTSGTVGKEQGLEGQAIKPVVQEETKQPAPAAAPSVTPPVQTPSTPLEQPTKPPKAVKTTIPVPKSEVLEGGKPSIGKTIGRGAERIEITEINKRPEGGFRIVGNRVSDGARIQLSNETSDNLMGYKEPEKEFTLLDIAKKQKLDPESWKPFFGVQGIKDYSSLFAKKGKRGLTPLQIHESLPEDVRNAYNLQNEDDVGNAMADLKKAQSISLTAQGGTKREVTEEDKRVSDALAARSEERPTIPASALKVGDHVTLDSEKKGIDSYEVTDKDGNVLTLKDGVEITRDIDGDIGHVVPDPKTGALVKRGKEDLFEGDLEKEAPVEKAKEPWEIAKENTKQYADSLRSLSDNDLRIEEKRTGEELNKWAKETPSIISKDSNYYLNPNLHTVKSFEIGEKFNAVNTEIESRESGIYITQQQYFNRWLSKTIPTKDRAKFLAAKDTVARVREQTNANHKRAVQQALSEGKPVFPEVLKDYPELNPPEEELKFMKGKPAEKTTIESWARKKFGDTVAKNGQPAWKNFVDWFGNSKVVDENGEPLVVYHGTGEDFNVFDKKRLGKMTKENASSAAIFESSKLGFWFNENRIEKKITGATKSIPAYLSINDPRHIESTDQLWYALQGNTADDFINETKTLGHDGIIIENDTEFGGKSYIVFFPPQIKSATGNIGTFSPTEEDIRFQKEAPLERRTQYNEAAPQRVPADNQAPAKAVLDWLERSGIVPSGEGNIVVVNPTESEKSFLETAQKLFTPKNGIHLIQLSDNLPASIRGFNGLRFNGMVFVNTDAMIPKFSILNHEAFHKFRLKYPVLFRALERFTFKNLTDEGKQALVKQIQINREGFTKKEDIAKRGTHLGMEELSGDFLADESQNEKFWTSVLEKLPAPGKVLLKSILDVHKRFVYGSRVLKRTKEIWFKDIEAQQKALQDFFDAVMHKEHTPIEKIPSFMQGEIESQMGRAPPEAFMHQAYHGSPHKFDRFAMEKVGTGEGAQSFGWGLYFSSERNIAEHYATKLSGESLIINEKKWNFGSYIEKANLKKSEKYTDDELREALGYIQDNHFGFESSSSNKIKAIAGEILRNNKIVFLPKNLYSVTLHKGKSPDQYDYLLWDDKINESQLIKISNQAEKEGIEQLGKVKEVKPNIKSKYSLPEVLKAGKYHGMAENDILLQIENDGDAYRALTDKFPELTNKENWAEIVTKDVFGRTSSARSINDMPLDGAGLYGKMAQLLGSQKAASEFLLRAGIDGIKYPAGTLSGVESDAFNYVIFDPNAITIEEQQAFMKRGTEEADYLDTMKKQQDLFGTTEGERSQHALSSISRQREQARLAKDRGTEDLPLFEKPEAEQLKLFMKKVKESDLPDIYEQAKQIDKKKTAKAIKEKYQSNRKQAGLLKYLVRTSSGRLLNISPVIRDQVQKHVNKVMLDTRKATFQALPFLNKLKSMSDADYRVFDIAAKNADTKKMDELIAKYDMQKEYEKYRQMMNDIIARAKIAGYETGYLQDYFPRMQKEGDTYKNYIRGTPEWGQIEEVLREKEKIVGRPLTDEEEADFIGLYLRGYGTEKMQLSKPGQLKERKIRLIDNEMNSLLMDVKTAIPSYIEGMIKKISRKEFFAPKEPQMDAFINDIDERIGEYVRKQIEEKKLDPRKQDELVGVLRSYFNYKPTNKAIATIKNLGYITSMGSGFSSMFSQMQDAYSSFYTAPANTIPALAKSLFGKTNITIKDLGIQSVAEEFRDVGKMAKYTDKLLSIVGLKWLDSVMKNAFLEANLSRYQDMAKSGKFTEQAKTDLQNIFGTEAETVIDDLKKGVSSDNVMLLLANQISKFQPTTLLQSPQALLDSPRARIAYTLKTYQIAQFNAIIDEGIRGMRTAKSKADYINAAKKVATMVALLMASGMGTDKIKDLLFGREVTWGELAADNLLKIIMISRYIAWKARQDGMYNALLTMVAPPFSWIDYVGKDIKKAISKPEDFKLKNMESLRVLPVVGQELYWWFGGGREKQKAMALKKLKKEHEKIGVITGDKIPDQKLKDVRTSEAMLRNLKGIRAKRKSEGNANAVDNLDKQIQSVEKLLQQRIDALKEDTKD